ncbi:hypothetical protein LUZ60_010105 [Juncus effusus]|nr:hypothetical protein LUZ60_010105 [Juncus effusus]
MASIKASSRYSSMDRDRRSSSSTSSSSPSSHKTAKANSSKALVRAKTTPQGAQNLGSLLRKLVDKRSAVANKKNPAIVPPHDPIAKEVKKAGKGGGNFSALSRKLFQKGSSGEQKALTEVKTNTRTLAMVLRSERELLAQNKENEDEISQLHQLLEDKNREVEKLKDLCLRQREEMKGLKDAILFPEERNKCQLEETVEKQKSELKQAKQVIPALQTQVSSLTAQLHSLALDLAQVKAQKYNARRTSMLNDSQEETAFPSVDYSAAQPEPSEYGSPQGGGIFFKDFNPCLTPRFSKQLSMDYDSDGCGSPSGSMLSDLNGGLKSKSSSQRKATKIYKFQSEEENWSQGRLASQNLFSSP